MCYNCFLFVDLPYFFKECFCIYKVMVCVGKDEEKCFRCEFFFFFFVWLMLSLISLFFLYVYNHLFILLKIFFSYLISTILHTHLLFS
jgi:hypothetical protein